MPSGADYYNALGLTIDATPEEIRTAYFEAARRLHPDINPDPKAQEIFLQIQTAYDVLSNPRRRADYDAGLPADLRARPDINLSVKYSRPAVPAIGEAQLFYVLLDLNCTAELDATRTPPVNLCLVIDRSTSMRGERMDMVKANVVQLVRQLRPHDILSLVLFSDRAEVFLPPMRVADINRLESQISMVQCGGATEIFRGLEAGYSLLTRYGDSRANRHLVLLTDGHTYGDEAPALNLAERAAQENIATSALGIGSEWNDVFLDRLTSFSGGNTYLINSARELENFFDKKIRGLEVQYARSMRVSFQSDPNVLLRYVFRLRPDVGPLPVEHSFSLGSLQYGRSASLLLEFLVEPLAQGAQEIHFMHGQIQLDIPSLTNRGGRILLDIKRPVLSTIELEPPPPAVIDAISRLTLYRLQEKAHAEVAAGQITDAAQHLQHLATHLLAQGDRKLAHTVLMEAEHIQQNHEFSEEGSKRVKYGTRALLMSPGSE
ncbi:MAG TPA: DnaJ domain-containing protein [Anaerolineaceae bacterium]|nr:DnaJ domain-containing protein [Anaerolineaceae bacterium]HOG78604.1 DnaJ domain-containing protein [Anaerolineaceae bacterium]